MLMTSAYCNADNISLLQCCCHQLTVILMKSAYCNTDDLLLHTVPDSPPGVYLYLGYSRIDAEVLKQGRMKLNDEVPLVHYFFLNIFSQFVMFFMYFFQHWFICSPSDFSVSKGARLNPGMLRNLKQVATGLHLMPYLPRWKRKKYF